jgi:hypothetical protein
MSNTTPEDEAANAIDKAADTIGLEKTGKLENLRNVLIAAMSGIPIVGGPLATLAEDYIPKQKEKRLIAFVEQLSEDVNSVKDQVRTDVVNTDDFAFLFENTLKGVMDSWQQDKIDCYRAILLNTLTGMTDLSAEEKEVFLQLLDNLTTRHIRIMGVLFQNHTGDLDEVVHQSYPEYDKDSIYYIMDDLRNKGLVHERGAIYDSQLSNNFNQLSVMGKKFVEFITRVEAE